MRRSILALVVAGFMLGTGGAAAAGQLWATGSPDWGGGPSGPGPVIFRLDTSTGAVSGTWSFEGAGWMWISGLADSGRFLYATHNAYDTQPDRMDTHDFKVAKIDRATGAVLSESSIAGFLGQTYSQVNALEFHDGHLYAVENATSGSALRGYALEVLLDAAGDVAGAEVGAFVGRFPDAGLDYHDGLWYATSWGYTPRRREGSLVYTSPDIMTTPFTRVGSGNSGVEGIGMIDGWEFESDGRLVAVTWYPIPGSATAVYSIDTATWTATSLFDLAGEMPAAITTLDGLSNVVPVPLSRDDCKDGGWMSLVNANGQPFKNQGDCVSYASNGK